MRGSHILSWAAVLAVIVLLNLPVPAAWRVKSGTRDGIAPFENFLSLLIDRGRRLFFFLPCDSMDEEERKSLLARIAELRYELDQTEFLRRDNAELRKMLNFIRRQSRSLSLCEVISRGDVGGWWQTIVINKGSDDGIKEGSPVITTRGLVGRVSDVSRLTSVVLLITDPACRVSCRIAGGDLFGIVTGTGVSLKGHSNLEMLTAPEPLAMSYVSRDYMVKPGDTIVTSGLGGIFHEGLVVGYVLTSAVDSSDLYQRLKVVPAAKLAGLRYVFVIGE